MAVLQPGVSDSASLGWGPIICISNKFPGDAVGLGARLKNHTPVIEQKQEPRAQ